VIQTRDHGLVLGGKPEDKIQTHDLGLILGGKPEDKWGRNCVLMVFWMQVLSRMKMNHSLSLYCIYRLLLAGIVAKKAWRSSCGTFSMISFGTMFIMLCHVTFSETNLAFRYICYISCVQFCILKCPSSILGILLVPRTSTRSILSAQVDDKN
jgi:hypothetical protein